MSHVINSSLCCTDKEHSAAWTNLGILYETSGQLRDAYACYLNATKGENNSKQEQTNNNNNNTSSNANQNNTNNTPSGSKLSLKNCVTTAGGKPQSLSQRIKFLQQHLSQAPMPSITSKRRSLPSSEYFLFLKD